MTAEQFRAWRRQRSYTQTEAARRLGLSVRMVRYYEADRFPIPRTVVLAMIGLSFIGGVAASTLAHLLAEGVTGYED